MKKIIGIDEEKNNAGQEASRQPITSQLKQWPVKLKVIPPTAPFLENAAILVSADCCAYAYGDFHNKFMKEKVTVIACSRFDIEDHGEKFTNLLSFNNTKSITITRMDLPCCKGIEKAVITAIEKSGKKIPVEINVLSTAGEIIENRSLNETTG